MPCVERAGLPNIILHDWHNYFLHYDLFLRFLEGRFVIEKSHTFNLYYLLTRVFTNMFAKFEALAQMPRRIASLNRLIRPRANFTS